MIKVKGPSGVELPVTDRDLRSLERAVVLIRGYEITMELAERTVSAGLIKIVTAMKGQPVEETPAEGVTRLALGNKSNEVSWPTPQVGDIRAVLPGVPNAGPLHQLQYAPDEDPTAPY